MIVLTVVTLVAVQVAAPIRGLAERGGSLLVGADLVHHDGRQIYFGWQMFSTTASSSVYEVTFVDGSSSRVEARRALGPIRGRMGYSGQTQRWLCDDLDAAVMVSGSDGAHPC